MFFNFIWRTVDDIHVSAICLPARPAGCIVLVRIREAPVVFRLVPVLPGPRLRIAPLPELFDELSAFMIGGQL